MSTWRQFVFFDYENRLTTSFPSLFENPHGSSPTEEIIDNKAEFGQRWGWLGTIDLLASNDVTKWDAVTQLPLTQCLNFIAMAKEKSEIDKLEGAAAAAAQKAKTRR